jgi:hypothetical protein
LHGKDVDADDPSPWAAREKPALRIALEDAELDDEARVSAGSRPS